MPANLGKALDLLIFPLLVSIVIILGRRAVTRVRRWRGRPASAGPPHRLLPITVDASGLRFGSRSYAVAWSEVSAVSLVGPTPTAPATPLAVRWSLHGRDPILVEADDMAEPPETVILLTWAYRPDLRWAAVDRSPSAA
ncbi:hypothetical protein [Catellatospora methionotrophica]|uniref:hypothetical protein n=1 Tax=Catellatospora methionotrophica TaxID=121620 RepID=UPI0033DC3286